MGFCQIVHASVLWTLHAISLCRRTGGGPFALKPNVPTPIFRSTHRISADKIQTVSRTHFETVKFAAALPPTPPPTPPPCRNTMRPHCSVFVSASSSSSSSSSFSRPFPTPSYCSFTPHPAYPIPPPTPTATY